MGSRKVEEFEVKEQISSGNFENDFLPHLDAAYNLARWLTRNDQDAEDVVQESYLRAFRFFGGIRGGNTRAWLLKIVRNTCYTQLQNNRPQELATTFDEEIHSEDDGSMNPETLLLRECRQPVAHAGSGRIACDLSGGARATRVGGIVLQRDC